MINEDLKSLARPIDFFKPDPRNARRHPEANLRAIRHSLKNFGQQKPIVALVNGIVIAGNGTLQVARELKFDQLAAVIFKDESKARAFALADNRSSELSTWEEKVLAQELESLKEQDRKDLGWEDRELDALLKSNRKPESDKEQIPEPPRKPLTKPGQVWSCGRHRVSCGDATSSGDLHALLKANTADLLFTSPPYNLGESIKLSGNLALSKKGNAYQDHKDKQDPESYFKLLSGSLTEGMLVSRYQAFNIQLLAGNSRAVFEMCHYFRNQFVDLMVWDKTRSAKAGAERVLNSQFELIFIWTSEKKPSRAIRIAPQFRGELSNIVAIPPQTANEFYKIHGATMPLELASKVVGDFTRRQALVLDPFGGTGTTLVACEDLGRSCFTLDKDPAYVDVMVERWQNRTGGKAKLLK